MFCIMPTASFLFAEVFWMLFCWFSTPMSVFLFCTYLQSLDFHRANCCVLCCLSCAPENKLHQIWPWPLPNPANTFQWGFAAPLKPSLLLMSVSRTFPSPRCDYPNVCGTSNSVEIFSPSQSTFSHFRFKVASPELVVLVSSMNRKAAFAVVLAWLQEFSWFQWFS